MVVAGVGAMGAALHVYVVPYKGRSFVFVAAFVVYRGDGATSPLGAPSLAIAPYSLPCGIGKKRA